MYPIIMGGGQPGATHSIYNIQKVQVTKQIAMANIKMNTILFNC